MSVNGVFASRRTILTPTSLWPFWLSLAAMGFGYKMLQIRRIRSPKA